LFYSGAHTSNPRIRQERSVVAPTTPAKLRRRVLYGAWFAHPGNRHLSDLWLMRCSSSTPPASTLSLHVHDERSSPRSAPLTSSTTVVDSEPACLRPPALGLMLAARRQCPRRARAHSKPLPRSRSKPTPCGGEVIDRRNRKLLQFNRRRWFLRGPAAPISANLPPPSPWRVGVSSTARIKRQERLQRREGRGSLCAPCTSIRPTAANGIRTELKPKSLAAQQLRNAFHAPNACARRNTVCTIQGVAAPAAPSVREDESDATACTTNRQSRHAANSALRPARSRRWRSSLPAHQGRGRSPSKCPCLLPTARWLRDARLRAAARHGQRSEYRLRMRRLR